jgi:hypothetical protein
MTIRRAFYPRLPTSDIAGRMKRLAEKLQLSSGDFGHDGLWTPDTIPDRGFPPR